MSWQMIVQMCEEKRRLERERPLAVVFDPRFLASQNYRVHRDRRGRRWKKPC